MQTTCKLLIAATLGIVGVLQATPASATHAGGYEYHYGAFYERRIRANNLCMDVDGWSQNNGARIAQWGCHGGGNQKFRQILKFKSNTGHIDYWNRVYKGFRLQAAHSNKCLDVPFGNAYNGAPVQQWDCNDNDAAQLWTINHWNGNQMCTDGWCVYRLQNTSYCLDVPNGTTRWGTKLQLYSCNGTNAQRFKAY